MTNKMITNELYTKIQCEFDDIPEYVINGFSIYLFGSILSKKRPNDIDVLITYNSKVVNIERAIEFRKYIKNKLEKSSNLSVDICLLSDKENEQSRFSYEEDAKKIK